MPSTIVLRFRDLVTEPGGTIQEHQKLIAEHGEVWWGWWMRQYETSPLRLFGELTQRLRSGDEIYIYQLNTGATRVYRSLLVDIIAAPKSNVVGTPDASRAPVYYHRAKYPAWFLLKSIELVAWETCEFYYESFPTRPEKRDEWAQLLGHRVASPEQLRHIDVTLWAISDRSSFG